MSETSLTPICACGHENSLHRDGFGFCSGMKDDVNECECLGFKHDGTYYNEQTGDVLDIKGRVVNA